MRSTQVVLGAIFVAAIVVSGVAIYRTQSRAAGQSICSFEYSEQCFNDWNGGKSYGNRVAAYGYESGDNHEDFYTRGTSLCNDGRVTHTCPFTVGDGLNNRYYNDDIDEFVYAPDTSDCVGWVAHGNGQAALEPCGSASTIFVQNVPGGDGTSWYVENVLASDNGQYDEPTWLCDFGGTNLALSAINYGSGKCQWQQE